MLTKGILQGHSLGRAYCSLTHGEFLRRQAEPQFVKFKFGDTYSFAAPRVGLEPFASAFGTFIEGEKHAFRIVNEDDPVPTFPPRTKDQLTEYPFTHVDRGWLIQLDARPEKMESEQYPNKPVDPQSIPEVIWEATNHSE